MTHLLSLRFTISALRSWHFSLTQLTCKFPNLQIYVHTIQHIQVYLRPLSGIWLEFWLFWSFTRIGILPSLWGGCLNIFQTRHVAQFWLSADDITYIAHQGFPVCSPHGSSPFPRGNLTLRLACTFSYWSFLLSLTYPTWILDMIYIAPFCADHFYELTKAYWVVFSLIYVCAILILAVSRFNLSNSEIAHSVKRCAPTPWTPFPLTIESFGMRVNIMSIESQVCI